MAGPVRVPEMSVAPHHLHSHYAVDNRSLSIFTNPPLSPAGTLSPILHRPSQDQVIYSPDKAYFSPSRDSFVSKPSISEASHVPSSPSSASFSSDHQGRAHSHHAESSRHTEGHSDRSGRGSPRRPRDVEKLAGSSSRTPRRSPGPSTVISDVTTVTYTGDYDQRDERRELESKTLRILVCPVLPNLHYWKLRRTVINSCTDLSLCLRTHCLLPHHRLDPHLPHTLPPLAAPSHCCQDPTSPIIRAGNTSRSRAASPTPSRLFLRPVEHVQRADAALHTPAFTICSDWRSISRLDGRVLLVLQRDSW